MNSTNLRMNLKVRLLLVLAIIILGSYSFTTVNGFPKQESYKGLIILKVENLEEKSYMDIQESMVKSKDLSIKYGCVDSDIIVIKILNTQFASKADNELMVKRKIRSVIGKKEIEVVFIDIQTNSGDSKC